MQQYRVNYPLLIGLAIGTFVCSGAVYGLWKFQIERKSGWLIAEADKAVASGDLRDAIRYYEQYIAIHTEDDEARFKYANAEIDLTEQDDATTEDISNAARSVEQILRNRDHGDEAAKKLRRRVIGLYGRDSVHNIDGAMDHIDILLESDPNDPELQALRANYLFRQRNYDEAIKYTYKLIGYDPKADKFDIKKATAPHQPEIYSALASIIRSKQSRPELAERIVDQMVVANPQAAEAYVQRGRLRAAWENADGARADAEKAYSVKPDDLDVLLFSADSATHDKKYDKAHEFIDKAKKLHPNEVRVYQAAALLEMKENHYKEALAQIEEGIKACPGAKAMELLFFKAELQIPANDVKGARQTIEDLQQIRNLRPEVLDYFDARILLAEGKWFEASEAFNKLRSRIGDFGRDRVAEVDFSLGLCYERLGKPDMALDQYELVAQQDPQNEPALSGVQRMRTLMGLENKDKDKTKTGGDEWAQAVAEMMKKPKDQQDMTKLNAILEKTAKTRNMDPTTVKLIQAQLAMMREDYESAGKLLSEANQLSPKNLQVLRFAITAARLNPKKGPDVAMGVLNKVVEQMGDLPGLRLDKADILIQQNKDKQDKEPLKRDLASLMTGIDQWTVPQKVELWQNMGARYLNLNMLDEARQYLTLAADNQPNELPLRLGLFSLALETNDEAGMKEAQDKILDIVKDKNDSSWLFAEARRRLWAVRHGRSGPEELVEIRKLAKQAMQQRPDWFELQALLAEVELLSNNGALALQYYDKAEELGRPTPSAVAQHIRLLAANARFADAGKLIDRIPEGLRQQLLGPLYSEILFRTNQVDSAVKQARAATAADPTNPQNQYWYGQLLARSTQASDVTPQKRNEIMGEAVKAMQRATELQPEFPDAWFALINYYAMQKDENQAQKTMRDAQLALSGDNLTIFLARSYEVLHRWFDAETMYREIYETDPKDIGRAQQLAAFYLGPIYQRPDKRDKATVLINQILKAGADKKIPASDNNLLWARRMAAKILATTGEYQNLVKAEKLLASNSQDGNLLLEDKLSLSEILASRPEPDSRLKAIGLLEEVSKVQPLNDKASIQLADLYFAIGNWQKYEEKMRETLGRFQNSLEARQDYARHLLARSDKLSLDRAAEQIQKLHTQAPNDPATFEMTVRLASKLGKQQAQKVRNDLLSRMPKMPNAKDLDQAKAQQFAAYANLLVELGYLDDAEKIYTELAARNPAMTLDLARFLGEHRDPDLCFAKLAEIYTPARVNDVLSVALAVARDRRDKIKDKYDAQIQGWLDAGLRENPDSIQLLITQGDLYDLQKKYDEAAADYKKLLARNDLTGLRRAVVLNNLSFLLALAGPSAGSDVDPLALIQEAAGIMGPNSDILDTRAVIETSKQKYKSAIEDLDLSVTDNPTALKYFHKAIAHYKANEMRNAVEAWEKAESLGLSHDSLNRMEFDEYDDMKTKIDQLRKRSVTQAETTRKAG